jgi:hypothetical protein
MKRLRDEIDSTDPRLAEAARLVAEVPPLSESDVRAQRVRRALERTPSARRYGGWSLAFGVTLGVVGTAGAVVGVATWMNSGPASQGSAESSTAVDSGAVDSGAAHSGAVDSGAAHSGAADSGNGADSLGPDKRELEELEADVRSRKDVSPKHPAQSRTGTREAPQQESSSEASLSEARLMQQAVEALRGSGDADKAEGLLRQYRKSAASGQLDEEALALSIEVSMARKDGKAPAYARQYLAKYPSGKFAPLARRALSKDEGPSER